MGTLQLRAGSAFPCLLPGTEQALPCQHRLDLNLLNCKVTQPPPTALPHPPRAATKMLPHIVTLPGCLLPLSAPQFQAQRLPTHTSTLTVNAFHPQLRELLCPCLQQSHCHSDTVTRKHTCQPSTHKTGRLTAMPPAFRAPCPHPLLLPVISPWSATPQPLNEALPGPLYTWLQVPTFANDQLAEWPSGWEVAWGQVTSRKVKLSDDTLISSSVTQRHNWRIRGISEDCGKMVWGWKCLSSV